MERDRDTKYIKKVEDWLQREINREKEREREIDREKDKLREK
jgi:hypothetical protein